MTVVGSANLVPVSVRKTAFDHVWILSFAVPMCRKKGAKSVRSGLLTVAESLDHSVKRSIRHVSPRLASMGKKKLGLGSVVV